MERKLVIPTFPFGSLQSRYYRRFYPFFRCPHPPPFYFESFQQSTNLSQHKVLSHLISSHIHSHSFVLSILIFFFQSTRSFIF
jgi:hypothetical protein